jgi:hypothetical protein
MTEDIFNKKVGTKEQKALEGKPVVVLSKSLEPVIGKTKNVGKEIGKKLVLIVKHPDRQEPINLSQIVYIVGKNLRNTALWYSVDEDGNIQKGSPVAVLMKVAGVDTLAELDGKTLQTEVDESKFLTIKGY